MRKPQSMRALEELGRVRLSENFFMRDFLHSEIASFYGIPNIPDDPDLAIEAGSRPLRRVPRAAPARGSAASRSARPTARPRSTTSATSTSSTADRTSPTTPATSGIGATPAARSAPARRSSSTPSSPTIERTGHWEALAWWIHDHLPYDDIEFFPKFAAFNSRLEGYARPAASTPTSRRAGQRGIG